MIESLAGSPPFAKVDASVSQKLAPHVEGLEFTPREPVSPSGAAGRGNLAATPEQARGGRSGPERPPDSRVFEQQNGLAARSPLDLHRRALEQEEPTPAPRAAQGPMARRLPAPSDALLVLTD